MGKSLKIKKAANFVHNSSDALLELLLKASSEAVFDRIYECPTYPLSDSNEDLTKEVSELESIINDHPARLSNVLAILYEQAVDQKHRKDEGQFFTPQDIAERIVHFIGINFDDTIVDPGCGTGIFISPVKTISDKLNNGSEIGYIGIEKSPILALSSALVLEALDCPPEWRIVYSNYFNTAGREIKEFCDDVGLKTPNRIVTNPPFIRFHKAGDRDDFIEKLQNQTGLDISGYAGVHMFFLAQSLLLLEWLERADDHRERSVTILFPSNIEGTQYSERFFEQLHRKLGWEHISSTFSDIEIDDSGEFNRNMPSELRLYQFYPSEHKFTTDIKDPRRSGSSTHLLLESVATIRRGISTGANEFFLLSKEEMKQKDIPEGYLSKAIPTKIEFESEVFTPETWFRFKNEGKDCYLLSVPEKKSLEELPTSLREYLQSGVAKGIHMRTTCRKRNPWYSVPILESSPDILFTYVSQGDPKFIFNDTNAYALTNLLTVSLKYSEFNNRAEMANAIQLLNDQLDRWTENNNIGRRYDRGLYKIEPGELSKMPLDSELQSLLDPGFTTLDSFS